jgi:hypothetical protein
MPPQRPGVKDSYDGDDKTPGNTSENNDDQEHYGRAATSSERQAATATIQSYYVAGAASNGAQACSLLIPTLVETIGGKYEAPSDPSYLHGRTCAEVMTKLFEHQHARLAKQAAGLEVTAVRIAGHGTGIVLLAFKGIRERRYLAIELSGGEWKLTALGDSPYP